jgi:hypothetical protein
LIDTINTSNLYLKFEENNENDITFCYFSCLGWYCFQPMSMAALSLSALARCATIRPFEMSSRLFSKKIAAKRHKRLYITLYNGNIISHLTL